MLMALISPSKTEVFLTEELCRSPRLVSPRLRLVAAEFVPKSLHMIFFSDERLHIAKDGHQRATRGHTRQGARPPPSWPGCGPPLVFCSLSIFIISKNKFRGVSGLLELCRIGL